MKRWSSLAFLTLALGFPQIGTAQSCIPPDVTITFNASSSDGYVCGGQSFTAEVPDAGSGATYAWETANPYSSITSGQGTRTIAVSTQNAFYGPEGNLHVTVTNACGTKSGDREFKSIPQFDRASVSVTPSPTIIGIGPVGCANSDYIATLSPGPEYVPPERTYQWQVDNGTILSGQGTLSIAFRSGSGPVSWSVLQQDRCSPLGAYHAHTDTMKAVAAVDPSPTVVAPSRVAPNSMDNAASLTNWQDLLLNGKTPISYLFWSIENGTLQGDPPTAIPMSFIAGSSGNVVITATVIDYCGHTYTPSATIPIGYAPVSIVAQDRLCGNEAAHAFVTPVPGASYAWSVTGGAITAGQGTPAIAFTTSSQPSVVVAVNVNSQSASKSIDVLAVPDATIAAISPVDARATMTASVPDAGPGARYAWSIANGTISGLSDGPQVAYVAGNDGGVQLNAIVTNDSGCTSSGAITVAIRCAAAAISNLKITYTGLTSGCSDSNGRGCARGETIRFRVSSSSCDTVRWTFGATHSDGTTADHSFDYAGIYPVSVEVRNALGSGVATGTISIAAERRRAAGH